MSSVVSPLKRKVECIEFETSRLLPLGLCDLPGSVYLFQSGFSREIGFPVLSPSDRSVFMKTVIGGIRGLKCLFLNTEKSACGRFRFLLGP